MDSCWITQKYLLVLNCTDLKYIVLLASHLRGFLTVSNSPVSAAGSDFPPVQRCERCSQSAWSAAAGERAAAAGSARWSSDTLGWCCGASPAKRTPEEEQDKPERWAFHKIKVCNNYLANGYSLIACNTVPFHCFSGAHSHNTSSSPPSAAGTSSAPLCKLTETTGVHTPEDKQKSCYGVIHEFCQMFVCS